MKIHRFYIGNQALASELDVSKEELIQQWRHVLRYKAGQQMCLFNDKKTEAKYRIQYIGPKNVKFQKIKDVLARSAKREAYLFWSLVKRDNNELILQKCTELGVSHFIPLISDRTIKKEINLERAKKILIEAAEQCGRADVPQAYLPLKLEKAIQQYGAQVELYALEQSSKTKIIKKGGGRIGVFIGPEGGWSEREIKLFEKYKINTLNVADFTLRAETAAIAASTKLL